MKEVVRFNAIQARHLVSKISIINIIVVVIVVVINVVITIIKDDNNDDNDNDNDFTGQIYLDSVKAHCSKTSLSGTPTTPINKCRKVTCDFFDDFRHFARGFMPCQMIELENVLFGLFETDCEIINLCV